MCRRKERRIFKQIKNKTNEIRWKNEDSSKIDKIVRELSKFLKNETTFETNQEVLGMIKIWIGNNLETSEDRKHNKIIVKASVDFYNECWVNIWKSMLNKEQR